MQNISSDDGNAPGRFLFVQRYKSAVNIPPRNTGHPAWPVFFYARFWVQFPGTSQFLAIRKTAFWYNLGTRFLTPANFWLPKTPVFIEFTILLAKFARVRTPYAPPPKKQAPTVGIIAFEALAIKYARYKGGTSQFLANGQTGRDAPFLLDFSRYDHKSQKIAEFFKKLQNNACFIPLKVYNKSMKESTTPTQRR